MSTDRVKALIRRLGMAPHPEGGWFKETYRAATGHGGRRHSTAILFLLERGQVSHLHRIASDEVWHFHLGGPLDVIELTPQGDARATRLGLDLEAGHLLQHVVPGGLWFGAQLAPEAEFALVGCTVAPGFEFADFEFAKRADLLAAYPKARETILRLT